MRQFIWLAAATAVLAAASSAHAQRRGPIFFGGTVDPTQLIFQPVDISASVVPIAEPQMRQSGFRLTDLLPRISFPIGRPLIGRSTFPTQSQLPGADYLKAFRFRYAQPVGGPQ